MVKGSLATGLNKQGTAVSGDIAVQEDAMLHVFHAYAAYNPPFRRSMTVVVDEASQDSGASSTQNAPLAKNKSELERQHAGDVATVPSGATFSQLPPQTHGEVVQEAEALFSRIIEDINATTERSNTTQDGAQSIFQYVELTPRLLNAYLSVHYAHSSFHVWSELYRTLHSNFGVPRNAWTYVEALERCSRSKKGPERVVASRLAEEIWAEWFALQDAWRSEDTKAVAHGLTPRLIERGYSAMVRALTLSGHLDRALDLVRTFMQHHPPSALRVPISKSTFRSTRTSLIGARPLVRSMSDADIPDDRVPPLLTFTEVEVLHHKLAAADRVSDIKYLKWVCKSYEGALRARRDAAIRAKPPSEVASSDDTTQQSSLL